MKFEIGNSYKPSHEPAYVYREDEYSIDYCARRGSSSGGVIFNDLCLELDSLGKALYVSGFCPHSSWTKRELVLPDYSYHELHVSIDSGLTPGIYHRVNADKPWRTFVDVKKQLICLGDVNAVGEGYCFDPGSILIFTGEVVSSLWLFNVNGIPDRISHS